MARYRSRHRDPVGDALALLGIVGPIVILAVIVTLRITGVIR